MVEINDQSLGNYNKDNQVRFKTSILMSSLIIAMHIYLLKELQELEKIQYLIMLMKNNTENLCSTY